MSSERFVVRENKYGNWEVVDTQTDKPVHLAAEKEYADRSAFYLNQEHDDNPREDDDVRT